MWDALPDEVKKKIIKMNPSLKSLHVTVFEPCLKSIRYLRHEKMCVECIRGAIFGDNSIIRRPSVTMYYTLENSTARISCSCREHSLLDYNSDRGIIKNGIELDYNEIFTYMKNKYNYISHVVRHTGLDENHMDILLRISDGDSTSTFANPVSRWERLVLG